jgi:hypothetical protein
MPTIIRATLNEPTTAVVAYNRRAGEHPADLLLIRPGKSPEELAFTELVPK